MRGGYENSGKLWLVNPAAQPLQRISREVMLSGRAFSFRPLLVGLLWAPSGGN